MKVINKNALADYENYIAPATDWLTISQDRVNQFADCTLDHQFIHVDPERAKVTPFGGTIVHGFLTLSFLSHFAEQFGLLLDDCQMSVNYGFDKLRFVNPVPVGSRVRAHARLLEVEQKSPNQYLFRYEVSVEIEGQDKPALIAHWLGMQVLGD